MNTVALLMSVWALAQPDPDWSTAGVAGLVTYAVVSLGKVWIEAHRDAGHRDDCATRLADLQASVATLLSRGGDASPLPPCDRHPKS